MSKPNSNPDNNQQIIPELIRQPEVKKKQEISSLKFCE